MDVPRFDHEVIDSCIFSRGAKGSKAKQCGLDGKSKDCWDNEEHWKYTAVQNGVKNGGDS